MTAFLASLGLHVALLAVPVMAGLYRHAEPTQSNTLPNSVAMVGNSIEVEAPTPELGAAQPAAAAEPEAVDVTSLPPEPAPRAPERPLPKTESDNAAPPPATPTEPRPTPARKRVPPPARKRPTVAEASSSVATSTAPTSGTPAAGVFGQAGLAPGVRRLGYGFARSIPPATQGDAEWRELPVGHVGTIRIELEVDANNHLGAVKRWQARPGEPAPPAVLERLVTRTLILMRAGQFALSGSNDPGSERLVIDVEVRDEPAEDAADTHVVQLKFDPATPGHPNKAYFRYGTGRAVEAKVTTVRSSK